MMFKLLMIENKETHHRPNHHHHHHDHHHHSGPATKKNYLPRNFEEFGCFANEVLPLPRHCSAKFDVWQFWKQFLTNVAHLWDRICNTQIMNNRLNIAGKVLHDCDRRSWHPLREIYVVDRSIASDLLSHCCFNTGSLQNSATLLWEVLIDRGSITSYLLPVWASTPGHWKI